MKVTNLESGTPFSMGKGKNWSVLNPDSGADSITLNHAIHGAGHEFPQHIHDSSIDIILVLEGAVSLRQGEFYTSLESGEAALVPSGEVHGTVNTSGAEARLISFQIPPDIALYRGERNKADNETPKPQAGETSTVEIVNLKKGGPSFSSGAQVRSVFSAVKSSPSAKLDWISLESGDTYSYINEGPEAVVIVLSGQAALKTGGGEQDISRFDAVFLKGPETLSLEGKGSGGASLICCTALV
jgi:quercetin dioxygenase-like cupin family protein